MKAILITAAMALSTSLYAGTFDATDYPDLYDGIEDSKVFPTAIQPGFGDSYGSALFQPAGFVMTNNHIEKGTGNAYGSTLLDVGYSTSW
jgi:hypothetical protein